MFQRLILASICTTVFCGIAVAGDYQSVNIVEPVANASIHDNNGNMVVKLAVTPQLNSSNGDHFSLMLDGKKIVSGSTPDFKLANIDRGAHVLQVQIIARDGSTILLSPEVPFNMWRASALFREERK